MPGSATDAEATLKAANSRIMTDFVENIVIMLLFNVEL